ncbi:MAG: hemerythrin domain-containing protein [Anaerocolumna sp.]
MRLKNYLEQHGNITEEIEFIQKNMNSVITEELAVELAKHINILAGRLNIHLTMEDKYLYPSLLSKEKQDLTYSIEEYMKEMSGLANAFTAFKEKYNTKPRFLSNKDTFKSDAKSIMNKILLRISKEENTIYKLID